MTGKYATPALAADLLTSWMNVAWVGMIAIVVLLAIGVYLALKDRKRKAALTADAEPGHWTANCIDPLNMRVPMFVLLDSEGFTLFHSRTGASIVRTWRQVRNVSITTHRMRLKNCPGLTVALPDDESVELLFTAGNGRDAYARGAEQALAEFRRRLSEARLGHDRPEPG